MKHLGNEPSAQGKVQGRMIELAFSVWQKLGVSV